MTEPASKPAADALFLEPGEGQPIWFLRNRMTLKATAETTGGAFGLLETVIAPRFSPPLHVHHGEDESFYVIEGVLTMKCGERTFRAGAGAFVFLPRAACRPPSSSKRSSRHACSHCRRRRRRRRFHRGRPSGRDGPATATRTARYRRPEARERPLRRRDRRTTHGAGAMSEHDRRLAATATGRFTRVARKSG